MKRRKGTRPYYLVSKISKLRMIKEAEYMTPEEADKSNEWMRVFGSPNLIWVEDEEDIPDWENE